MQTGLTAGVLLILVGTVGIWGVTAGAATGRVRRNRLFGIRLGSTLASQDAWITGHRAALPACRVAAVLSLIGGAAITVESAITRDKEGTILFWLLVFAGYISVFVALVVAVIHAHRAAKAQTRA